MDVPIPTRTNGRVIDETWFNIFQQVLGGDILPRAASGNSLDEAGNLGDSSHAWIKAFINSGYWSAGDVKMHHSYQGSISPGQGWMKMDGRQVTQAAYDAEHGTGSWVKYVGSSPLLNKYLPIMSGRYPVGTSLTTQNGSVSMSPVGNTNHQINLQHSHTVNNHSHGIPSSGFKILGDASGTTVPGVTTDSQAPGTTSSLSTTQSIQPESIELEFYMRII